MNAMKKLGRLLGVFALMAGVGLASAQEEGAKPKKERPKRTPPAKVNGTVKAVDQNAKQITVTTENQEDKVYTLTEKVMITLRGPILDGIQAGDKAQLQIKEGDEPVVAKITITREGVSPAGRAKKEKKPKQPRERKPKKKKGGDAGPPPIE